MIKLNKIEDRVAGWVKPIPHLPANGRKWLADNIWWIILIGTILLGFTAIYFLNVLSMFGLGNVYMMNLYAPQRISGWSYFVTMVSLFFMVIEIILMSSAIQPLKKFKRKGWDLMFMVLLVNTGAMLVNVLINYNMYSPITALLAGVINFMISAYLLFEIRSYFIKK